MKNKQFIKLSTLLGLTLLLILTSTNIAGADPPDPPPPLPPTPVWEKLEPVFPPPKGEPWASSIISAQGAVKTFHAVADAEVRQGDPATNYGIEPTMGAGYDNYTSKHRLKHRALLDFNTTTYLPPGTVIHQATLRLYMAGYCDAYSTSYQAYRVASSWVEMGVTWNNQPSFAEGYGSRLIPASPAWGYYNFDVTNLVQAWANGSHPEYGIMIRGPESPPYACAFRDFLTKGGGGFTSAPELIVDYTLPAPAVSVSQNDISFFHQCGTSDLAPKTIAVKSNETTLHNWTTNVTGGSGWLSLDKTNGKTSFIFPDQIELSVSETTPCTGTLASTIQLSAAGLGGSPQTINVTFHQSDNPPNLVYLPIIIKNSGGVGGNSTTGGNSIGAASTVVKRIILLIGVGDYQYLPTPSTFSVLSARQTEKTKTQDLAFVMGDVGGMEDTMEQAFGPSEFSNPSSSSDSVGIIYLPEEFATKANVDYAIEYIDEREDENTMVLIYISGHGGSIGTDTDPVDEPWDQTDEMVGVYDTSFSPILTNAVIDDDLKAKLDDLETEHLAVIFDSCNSGGMEVTHPHRAVLAASQEDQGSWESAELEHGVFTYYMLRAMQEPASDTNGDDWVSIQEIYNYARIPVYDYVISITPTARQDIALDLTRDFTVVPVVSQ